MAQRPLAFIRAGINQEQITASTGCSIAIACDPNSPHVTDLFHRVSRVDVVVHQALRTAASGHLSTKPVLPIRESEIPGHLSRKFQTKVRDRINRRLVPRTAITQHVIKHGKITANVWSMRLGSAKSPFQALPIARHQPRQCDDEGRLEDKVRRVPPAIHRLHAIARMDQEPVANGAAVARGQRVMHVVEGNNSIRVDMVVNVSHPRSPTCEEFGIIESFFVTLDAVRPEMAEQPLGRSGNILGVALQREKERRRIAIAAVRLFL